MSRFLEATENLFIQGIKIDRNCSWIIGFIKAGHMRVGWKLKVRGQIVREIRDLRNLFISRKTTKIFL
jgi:hypothetical protein